jgi:hypothetical protein
VAASADDDSTAALSSDYQLRRLVDPTPAQRAAEQRGAIFIYDSLAFGQVSDALDQHFDRMQNMMFIRIHHLPPTGAGPARVDDDDC